MLKRYTTAGAMLLVIAVLFSLPVTGQEETRVYIPFVSNLFSGPASLSQEIPTQEIPPCSSERPTNIDLPDEFVFQGCSPNGGPMWGPPKGSFPAPKLPEDLAEKVVAGEDIYMDGEETLGAEIFLGGGKVLRLPPDMYVKIYIAHELRVEGIPGRELPLRILSRLSLKETKDRLYVEADGSLSVFTRDPAILARVRQEYIEVVEQLQTEPQLDPVLQALPGEHSYEIR